MKKVSSSPIFSWPYFIKIAQTHGVILLVSIVFAFLTQRYYFKNLLEQINHQQIQTQLEIIKKSNLSISEICNLKSDKYIWIVTSESSVLCQNIKEVFDKKDLEIKNTKEFFEVIKENKNYKVIGEELSSNITLWGGYETVYISNSLSQIDYTLWIILIPLIIFIYILLLTTSLRFSEPFRAILQDVYSLNKELSKKSNQLESETNINFKDALTITKKNLEGQISKIRAERDKNTALLESIKEGILAIDSDKKVLFFNKRFSSKFLNFLPSEDNSYILSDLLVSHPDLLQYFNEAIKTGSSIKKKAYKIKNKNRNMYYDLTVYPIESKSDEYNKGVIGVFNNVTTAKLSDKMRVDFVANVSHEMKTPLTSIKGFSQIIEGNVDNDPQINKNAISKILVNCQRLESLFDDLVDLSLIESKYKLKIQELSLKKTLTRVEGLLLESYKDKNIQIEQDLKEDIIQVEPKLFEQALMNLIDNAIKYSHQDVKIKISNYMKDQESLIITVSDNGIGISEKDLIRVFERFYRSQENSHVNQKGTGLGLSIVKHIIIKHKGKISAQNQENGGTLFKIEIPHIKS